MISEQLDDFMLRQLRPASLRQYLAAHGWKEVASPRKGLVVFEGPKDDAGEPIIQVIPQSALTPDFVMRARELVNSLAVIEDRQPEDVLNDITSRRLRSRHPFLRDTAQSGNRFVRLLGWTFILLLASAVLLLVALPLIQDIRQAKDKIATLEREFAAAHPAPDYSVGTEQYVKFLFAGETTGGKIKLTGASVDSPAPIAIDVRSSSGLVPAAVDVAITFKFPPTVKDVPNRTFKVKGVRLTPDCKQFIILKEALDKVARNLVTEINKQGEGGFATADSVPIPYAAKLTVTPVLPPAMLATPVFVAEEVPVAGTVPVSIRREDSKNMTPAPAASARGGAS